MVYMGINLKVFNVCNWLSKTEAKRLQDLGVAVLLEAEKSPQTPNENEPPGGLDDNGEMQPSAPAAADPVV